jgi:DNA-binding SARP family transcriptional activator/tetratricopeptide (TPR) repeat protein
MPSHDLLLQLFGSPGLMAGGVRRHDLPDSLPGYLTAHLAWRGDWLSRESLAGLLWPERADADAQRNLRVNLHRMRSLLQVLGLESGFDADRRRVRLRVATDVAAFRQALGRADWQRATSLQPAPLLETHSFRGFPLLEAWAAREREALAGAWRAAALKHALQAEESGQAEQAAGVLLRLIEQEGSEDVMQPLLRVAAAAGRASEALAAYERLCLHLHTDLGLTPAPATLSLARALKAGSHATPVAGAAGTVQRSASVPRSIDQPPRLVGRDAERARVADAKRRVVLVGGEPGVGKTRLLEDAWPTARWLSCREGLEAVPFAPVIEYLADHLEGLPDLGRHRLELARLLPALAGGEVPPPAEPAGTQARLLEAMAHALGAGASAIVFDDLQWSDSATRELVLHLARNPGPPIRLAWRIDELTPALDELFDALESIAAADRVLLRPLSADALTDLLADLAHTREGPPRFSAWLHHRVGGNPLFALQTLRALFESGRLQAHTNGWSSDLDAIGADYSALQIPSSMAGLVMRRLSNQPELVRRVLTVVAVIGAAVDTERIAQLAGVSAWSAAEAMAQAQSVGLLNGTRFAHDVVRHCVTQATPQALRSVLHAGVARSFAGVLPPAALAEHAWAAGDRALAVAHTLAAAEHDGHAGLHAGAIALLERTLGRDVAPDDQGRLHALLAQLWLACGDLERTEASAQAAVDAPAGPQQRAAALCCIALVRMQQGRLQEARVALEQAGASDPDAAQLLNARGQLAQLDGRAIEVVGDFERCVAALRRQAPGLDLVGTLASLGSLYTECGQIDQALPILQEAYRLAQRLGARYAQVEVAVNLLRTLSDLQRDDEAIAIAQESLALGDYDASATLRNNMAWSLRALGRLDEARAAYEQLRHGRDPTLALMASAKLVEMAGAEGHADQAVRGAQHLLDGLHRTEVYLARAVAVLAVLQFGSDAQVQQARTHLRPQPLDPSLSQRLSDALRARGIDPAAYLHAPPAPP